jgi:DNA-binding transcriptional LysR family regulator
MDGGQRLTQRDRTQTRSEALALMAIGWLDLELRHLATLRVLAEERSFRATAARLGFAQSGISRHISTLEQRVGTQLVRRGQGTRGVELTEAGEQLLQHADAILSIVATSERDFAHRYGTEGIAIRVATFQSVSATILAPAIAQTKRAAPSLVVDLVEAPDPLEALQRGEVDLAFSEQLPLDDASSHVLLLTDPYILAAASVEALPGNGRAVALSELAGLPLVTLRHSCHLAAVERELANQDIYLRPILRSDDAMTLHGLAASGAAVALLPQLALLPTPTLHLRAIDPMFRPRPICLVWNREPSPSPPVRSLAEAIRASAKRLQANGVGRRPTRLQSIAAEPEL